MNKDQMDKYAYELMVKNNPDEAVKNLLLKDKEIERLNNIINELENFIKTYAIPEFTLDEPHRLFMETKIILEKLKALKEDK